MRFLIDECLTVGLVTVAEQCGHETRHVAHIGRAGWKDWNDACYASDLRAISGSSYAAQPLHAGLVILIPGVSRVLQQKLFRAARDELAAIGAPVNRAVVYLAVALTYLSQSFLESHDQVAVSCLAGAGTLIVIPSPLPARWPRAITLPSDERTSCSF